MILRKFSRMISLTGRKYIVKKWVYWRASVYVMLWAIISLVYSKSVWKYNIKWELQAFNSKVKMSQSFASICKVEL